MKIRSKLIIFMLGLFFALGVLLVEGNKNSAYAATIGQQLTAAESGWQRIDDQDSKIYFSESFARQKSGQSGFYMQSGSYKNNTTNNDYISFKFFGSKLRILNYSSNEYSSNQSIVIDGNSYSFNEAVVSTGQAQTLTFEKLDLELKVHDVKIICPNAAGYTGLDAIDIDLTGYLVDSSAIVTEAITLNKTTVSLSVGQSDTLVAAVSPDTISNKGVTWISGNPSVATIDAAGKVTAVAAGTAVITATTQDGSNLSATCTITVNAQASNSKRVSLFITMNNNNTKQYDITMDEVEAFIQWYDDGSSPIYKFVKENNVAPYTKKTEYITYSNISSFEVCE